MNILENKLPEDLNKKIDSDANDYLAQQGVEFSTASFDGYIAGAAEYALKLHLLQQEYEALQRWKEEAKDLLNPIFEYAQDHPDMQLGGSMIEFVLNRCKEYDKLKGENNRLGDALNQSAKWLADEMAEHAALKEKADKMARVLFEIGNGGATPQYKAIAAFKEWERSNTNQNENNG